MAINPEKEDCFLLSDGPSKVKKSRHQLRYYINVPVFNVSTKKKTVLESLALPGGMGTSVEAYDRYIKRMNGWPVEGDED